MGEDNKQPQNTNPNTTSNFNVSSQPAPKKKGKGGVVFAIIVILLLLVVTAGLTYYFMYYTRPEQIYKRLISSNMNQYTSKLKDADYKTVKSSVKLGFNVKSDNNEVDQNVLNIINKTNIELNTQIDTENKKIIADLDSKYNNEDLLNVQMYSNVNDKKTYIYLKDLLNKYIELDMNQTQISNETDYYSTLNDTLEFQDSKKSAEKAAKILRKELLKTVKTEYCSSSKEDIQINDKKLKVTKNTLKMTGTQFENELKTVLNNLKNNEEFVSCFKDKDLFRKDVDEFLKAIDKEPIDESSIIEINIYTQGLMNRVVKVSALVVDDDDEVSLDVTRIEDDIYAFEVKSSEKEKTLNGSIYIEKHNDNEGKIVLEFNVEDFGKVALNIDYTTSYNEPIENVNVMNSVKSNELTFADQRTLYTNLQKSKLYEVILGFMGTSSSNTNNSILNMNNTTNNNQNSTQTIPNVDPNNNMNLNNITEPNTGEIQNQVLTYDSKTKITFGVPEGYKVNTTSENFKRLDKDTTSIRITSTISQEDSFYETIKEKADRYKTDGKYENVGVTDVETIEVENIKFYAATLSYTYANGNYKHEYKTKYIWTRANDKYILELETTNGETLTDDELKQILTMKIEDNQ